MGQAAGTVAEIGDAPVAERQQVFRRKAAACQIVDADRVDLVAAQRGGRAEEHGRKMRRKLLDPTGRVAVGIGENNAVHLVAGEKAEQLLGGLGVLLAVAQHDIIAQLAGVRFDAERNLGIKRIGHLGNDETDYVGTAADETARERVDAIALFIADLYDPLARCLAQLLGAAEGAGYGRSGDAGNTGDIFNGYVAHMACSFLP